MIDGNQELVSKGDPDQSGQDLRLSGQIEPGRAR